MDGTTLKIIALLLMTADHIGEFIPGRPHFLRLVGRLSAPVFIFCAVQGCIYTKDSKKRLKKLYLYSAGMGVIDFALNILFRGKGGVCDNNIFTSVFVISLLIHILENGKADIPRPAGQGGLYLSPGRIEKMGKRRRNTALLLAVAGPVFIRGLFYYIESLMRPLPVYNLFDRVIPNVITCEGSVEVIIMGLVFYFCRKDRITTRAGYFAYCCVYLVFTVIVCVSDGILNYIPLGRRLLIYYYQWLQILALPLIICYNGEKGKGYKNLFYIYYPLHIAILYISGLFIHL